MNFSDLNVKNSRTAKLQLKTKMSYETLLKLEIKVIYACQVMTTMELRPTSGYS